MVPVKYKRVSAQYHLTKTPRYDLPACPVVFTGSHGAGRNTLSISRINPPKFGVGLKFEPDPRGIGFAFHRAGEGIGQKGAFCKALIF